MRVHRITAIVLIILLGIAIAMPIYLLKYFSKDPHQITLYGNVDVRQVDLGFKVFGKVSELCFEEGDFVPKGAYMARLEEQPYADQLIEAIARLDAVFLALKNAEQIYQRRAELVEEGGVSQEDYDNAKTAKDVLKENLKEAEAALGVAQTNFQDTKLYSPNDGVILTRIREPGSVLQQGDPAYTLSLVSPVWIRAYIPEPLLGIVKLGMEANIYTDAKDGQIYRGKVGFISPVAEFTPKTVETSELRTDLVYQIRIYADNPDWGLKQGMPVTVKLDIGKNLFHSR